MMARFEKTINAGVERPFARFTKVALQKRSREPSAWHVAAGTGSLVVPEFAHCVWPLAAHRAQRDRRQAASEP
jgi:hypothetical protein